MADPGAKVVIREVALREAERKMQDSRIARESAAAYAQGGFKSLYLANGGAIISLLTIIGNSSASVETRAIFWAFVWFGCGLIAVLIAQVLTYFSETAYSSAAYTDGLQAEAAAFATGNTYSSAADVKLNHVFVNWAVTATFAALAMFIAGAFVALDAIT